MITEEGFKKEIRIWLVNYFTNEEVLDLGTCLTESPSDVMDMKKYIDQQGDYERKTGIETAFDWIYVENEKIGREALLQAAAPDLLEACRQLILAVKVNKIGLQDWMEEPLSYDELSDLAYNAIDKANGKKLK